MVWVGFALEVMHLCIWSRFLLELSWGGSQLLLVFNEPLRASRNITDVLLTIHYWEINCSDLYSCETKQSLIIDNLLFFFIMRRLVIMTSKFQNHSQEDVDSYMLTRNAYLNDWHFDSFAIMRRYVTKTLKYQNHL